MFLNKKYPEDRVAELKSDPDGLSDLFLHQSFLSVFGNIWGDFHPFTFQSWDSESLSLVPGGATCTTPELELSGQRRRWRETVVVGALSLCCVSAVCTVQRVCVLSEETGQLCPEAGPEGDITPGTRTASLVVASHSVLSSVVGNHMRWLFIGLFFR